MNSTSRADLSNHSIVLLVLGLLLSLALLATLWRDIPPPGSTTGQLFGFTGSLLLLGPALFSIVKRGESDSNPTRWFVIHVITACAGFLFIGMHVASADWLSPPGLLLLILVLLIIQGSYMRVVLTRALSQLFARNTREGGFSTGARPEREELRQLIDRKTILLARLDSTAQEALFSPALRHWLSHPILSLRYQQLAEQEALLVGGRASAPFGVRWARRWHLLLAALFFAGLVVHVITVLFFAGYVAGAGEITWWHITSWGAPE